MFQVNKEYFIQAIISNMIWGVTPIYFYYLSDVDAASLGYMIMPLITMFFGMLFLKEGFSAYQIVGALICVVGLSFDITVAFVSVFFFGEAITGARLITLVCLVTGLFFMTFFKTRTPSAVR